MISRAEIEHLMSLGWSVFSISEYTGLSPDTISRALND